jgi:hypothetical protein
LGLATVPQTEENFGAVFDLLPERKPIVYRPLTAQVTTYLASIQYLSRPLERATEVLLLLKASDGYSGFFISI